MQISNDKVRIKKCHFHNPNGAIKDSRVRMVLAGFVKRSISQIWGNSVRNNLIAISLAFLAISIPVSAHHGNASYDTNKKITLKATVTEWIWSNPHCLLRFDAKDDEGKIVHWVVESSNPADMINHGWSKETFKPGDKATVTFIPAKNGNPIGRIQEVVLANGQTLTTLKGLQ
jgi:hypothetical protein